MWLQIAKYKPRTPLKGDIMLKVIFVMPRPKNHFRTGKFKHLLKDDMPERVSTTPDLDNLVKLVADVIQPQMIANDSQICMLQAEKVYGKTPRTEVIIEEV